MLAAAHHGAGSCWLVFAEQTLNSKKFKDKYKVPQNYELLCPMTLDYPAGESKAGLSRRETVIFNL